MEHSTHTQARTAMLEASHAANRGRMDEPSEIYILPPFGKNFDYLYYIIIVMLLPKLAYATVAAVAEMDEKKGH